MKIYYVDLNIPIWLREYSTCQFHRIYHNSWSRNVENGKEYRPTNRNKRRMLEHVFSSWYNKLWIGGGLQCQPKWNTHSYYCRNFDDPWCYYYWSTPTAMMMVLEVTAHLVSIYLTSNLSLHACIFHKCKSSSRCIILLSIELNA